MRIVICGSMYFAKEMDAARKVLEDRGMTVIVPKHLDKYLSGEMVKGREEALVVIGGDIIRWCHKEIAYADALLVVNYMKGSVLGYIGGGTFLAMAFAHVLNKRIFVLYPLPDEPYQFRQEMIAMQPIILDGDLSRI